MFVKCLEYVSNLRNNFRAARLSEKVLPILPIRLGLFGEGKTGETRSCTTFLLKNVKTSFLLFCNSEAEGQPNWKAKDIKALPSGLLPLSLLSE